MPARDDGASSLYKYNIPDSAGFPERGERRYHVDNLALFGSRGDAREDSDIDILVDFSPGADLLDLSGLKLYYEDVFGRPVDVVPRRAIREELREAILADAIDI